MTVTSVSQGAKKIRWIQEKENIILYSEYDRQGRVIHLISTLNTVEFLLMD